MGSAWRRTRRSASRPPSATARIVTAPNPRPARAPATPISHPTIGPPIGVEPWKATNHSDITRPRIAGAAVSWRVELAIDMNEMLPQPTSGRTASSSGRLGASVATASAAAKPAAAMVSGRSPILPRAATTSPPSTAPTPIAAVMNPKPVAPACSPRLAITGSVTWNS
jgi:hypothetical protein